MPRSRERLRRLERSALLALALPVAAAAACGADEQRSASSRAAAAVPAAGAGSGSAGSAAGMGQPASGTAGGFGAGAGGSAPGSGASVAPDGGAVDSSVPPARDDSGAAPPADAAPPTAGHAALFWLDITGNRVLRAEADGSDVRTLASGNGIAAPDGVAVDVESGYVYWTNMGSGLGGANLGSLQRAPLDGGSVETVVARGVTNTPKQMTIDRVNRKLYWSDREGAKVWRANMDGSDPEILASGHGFDQLVGIALDVAREQFYFTDRNRRKILRAGFTVPPGETHETRSDIEELIALDAGSMPIDLDLDLDQRLIYWTDRALGTVQRASMDPPAGQSPAERDDIETLATDLGDAIGISLDQDGGAMYFTALTGQIWRAQLDGSGREPLAREGSATGIAFVRIPEQP